MKSVTAGLVALSIVLTPAPAFAWGATGHELVTGAAIDALSKNVPAFLKTKTARWQMSLLGREPDRSRGAGKTHDWERDSAHYINIGDDGLAEGRVLLLQHVDLTLELGVRGDATGLRDDHSYIMLLCSVLRVVL